jgi:hypothetical protein
MSMTPYELLTAGLDLIRDPKNWTTHTFARDALGNPIYELDDGATCFCSIGALYRSFRKAGNEEINQTYYTARSLLDHATPSDHNIVRANDRSTHDEVIQIWERAIADAA